MPRVAPFDGLLFDPAVVGDLAAATAPPYDMILAEDLARFRRGSSYSITNVDLTEGEAAAAQPDQYTRAGEIFRRWRREGALVPVGRRAVYPYEMDFSYQGEDRRVRGLIVEVGLEPWGEGILPHERTTSGPVEDRLGLLRSTGANLSPVYAVCPGPSEPHRDVLDRAARRPPARELVDERGVTHRLWIDSEAPDPIPWYRGETILVADGHHRYQTALVHRGQMRASRGPGAWDAVMMLLVDAASEDPPVLPIHRVVKVAPLPDLPGHLVRDLGEVLASLTHDDLRFGAAFRRDGDLCHLIGLLEGRPPTVSALHDQLLDRMDGVRGLRFVPDAAVAEESVRLGEADLALFLPPTSFASVLEVVEHGDRLPQKSTYFWPKPRTGMVIRPVA